VLDDLDDQVMTGRENAHDNALRFSLAGVQLKFSAVIDAAGGLTIPASGIGGGWIVKLPSREYRGVPENEFSMMTLAHMVGINVPPIDLVDIGGIKNLPDGIDQLGDKAFIIERFDRREDGTSVHIEDFAQVYGVYAEDKYQQASNRNIAAVIAAESDHADIAEFIRRLTFNTLIGNGDMHLKNWSLIYLDQKNAKLSPAYDFVSTIPYIPNDQSALNFSRTRRFDEFTEDEILHLARKAALPRKLVIDTVRETVSLFMERWRAEKAHLPMSTDVVDTIDKHLTTLPIIGEAIA
jgi:serine/threonine-protein kinase HipA